MEHRILGRTGLKVSALCLGTMTFGWTADEKTSFDIMDAAVEAGINFFETADAYYVWEDGKTGGESETIIGNWLRHKPRRDIIIATKVRERLWEGPNGEGLNRHHILHSVEDSLRRLQTDYIDLYQCHWPDEETPLEETMMAMDSLVRSGKVRYVGLSNYEAWLTMKSLWISDVRNLARVESTQPLYNLVRRADFERELMAVCKDQQIGVIPFSPLAAGFLTGKFTREQKQPDSTRTDEGVVRRALKDEQAFLVLDELGRIAQAHGVPVPQIALAWLLANDVITSPIVGARTLPQLQEVLGATDVKLSAEEIDALNKVSSKF